MSILKNNRWEKFALAYFGGENRTQSAITAGYSPTSARSTAARLITIPSILERIGELQEAAASLKIMAVTERKERLSEIARARISDFVECDESGARINIDLETANSAAIQEVKTRKEYSDKGAEAARMTRLKLHDPVKSISELNKMEGQYPPAKVELTGKDGEPIKVTRVVYKETEAKGK